MGNRTPSRPKFTAPASSLEHSPLISVFSRLSAPPAKDRTLPDSLLSGLSVVIATKNNGERLERTIRACAQYARNLPVEFIVVDYGSSDDTAQRLETLAAQVPNFRSLSVSAASAGSARNHGVAAAGHELILFLGESITPTVPTFFEHHMNAHHMLPEKNLAVLGRVTLANLPDDRVSFLMSHLHGAGAQQFGFHSLVPYTWLDWRYFYSENVSFKRSAVTDWASQGYRTGLTQESLLEDSEFAFRLSEQLKGGFPILYYPAASASQETGYSVRQFIDRQLAAGLSARTLFSGHPKAIETLGLDALDRLLASSKTASGPSDDLLRMIEGAKSWGVVIEANYKLGSQNWHADLLNAIFELSYLQGYVMGCPDRDADYAAAYRYCVERFQEKLATAAAFEVFGRFPSFTLT